MITQQEEIERIQEAYDIEKEELDELRARFDKLSGASSLMIPWTFSIFNLVDYEAIMAERKRIADEEERKRKEYELKVSRSMIAYES